MKCDHDGQTVHAMGDGSLRCQGCGYDVKAKNLSTNDNLDALKDMKDSIARTPVAPDPPTTGVVLDDPELQPGWLGKYHNPKHYAKTPTPISVIEAWGLNFSLGNAIKYIARADHKSDPMLDLRKASEYIRFEIERRERENLNDRTPAPNPNPPARDTPVDNP